MSRAEGSSWPLFQTLIVTVCALLSPWWIDMAQPVYVGLAGWPFARFLFSIVHLAPAAVLMGGTLPAVACPATSAANVMVR